jgi:hypothetical protein
MTLNLDDTSRQGFGNSNKQANTVIKMERQDIASKGPHYSLTIYGDGTLVYEGKSGVKIRGRKVSHLSESSINELIREFKNLYYFDLKDRYEQSTDSNSAAVTTSVTIGDKTKSVYHVHGSKAPSGLLKLESKIDKITSSNTWTGL